jgi:hypothetical protein
MKKCKLPKPSQHRPSSVANHSYARSGTLAIVSVLCPTGDKRGIPEKLPPVFRGHGLCKLPVAVFNLMIDLLN